MPFQLDVLTRMTPADEVRYNVLGMTDDQIMEMRATFVAMANVEKLANSKTKQPNRLSLAEIRRYGSDYLAILDGVK